MPEMPAPTMTTSKRSVRSGEGVLCGSEAGPFPSSWAEVVFMDPNCSERPKERLSCLGNLFRSRVPCCAVNSSGVIPPRPTIVHALFEVCNDRLASAKLARVRP